MAKPKPEKFEELEVVMMKKVAPERFDVVSGVIRGPLEVKKTLEKGVSLVVARGTARAAIDRQAANRKANLGLEVSA